MTEFFNEDPVAIKWVQMKPDASIGEVKEPHRAGLVGLRLSIRDVTQNGTIDWKTAYPLSWGVKLPKRPRNIKVRAFIY